MRIATVRTYPDFIDKPIGIWCPWKIVQNTVMLGDRPPSSTSLPESILIHPSFTGAASSAEVFDEDYEPVASAPEGWFCARKHMPGSWADDRPKAYFSSIISQVLRFAKNKPSVQFLIKADPTELFNKIKDRVIWPRSMVDSGPCGYDASYGPTQLPNVMIGAIIKCQSDIQLCTDLPELAKICGGIWLFMDLVDSVVLTPDLLNGLVKRVIFNDCLSWPEWAVGHDGVFGYVDDILTPVEQQLIHANVPWETLNYVEKEEFYKS